MKKSVYERGKLPLLPDGVYRIMGLDGHVSMIVSVQDGLRDGDQEYFHNNRLRCRLHWEQGLMTGMQYEFYQKGRPSMVEEWDNGVFTGNRTIWWGNGRMKQRVTASKEINFAFVIEEWYSTGARSLVQVYDSVGLCRKTRYSKEGELLYDRFYKHGYSSHPEEYRNLLKSYANTSMLSGESIYPLGGAHAGMVFKTYIGKSPTEERLAEIAKEVKEYEEHPLVRPVRQKSRSRLRERESELAG